MTTLSNPRFTIGRIAEATGVSANTIRAWYRRGDLTVGMHDQDSPGTTIARLLAGRTALAIGIMGALTSQGIAPKVAADAANHFAHAAGADRKPGRLFAAGETYLVVGPERSGVVCVRTPDEFASKVMAPAFYGRDRAPLVTILRLDELVDSIRVALGLDRDPLEAGE